MKTFYMSSANILSAIRWIARAITLIMTILIAVMFFGEGGSVHFTTLKWNESVMIISVLLALAGLLIAWRWEGFGGILTLSALITFSAVDFYTSGGVLWNVWIIGIPAALFLFCWWHTNFSKYNNIYRS